MKDNKFYGDFNYDEALENLFKRSGESKDYVVMSTIIRNTQLVTWLREMFPEVWETFQQHMAILRKREQDGEDIQFTDQEDPPLPDIKEGWKGL